MGISFERCNRSSGGANDQANEHHTRFLQRAPGWCAASVAPAKALPCSLGIRRILLHWFTSLAPTPSLSPHSPTFNCLPAAAHF